MARSTTLPLDKTAVGVAFLLGLVAILSAWGSQIFGGLVPCELCLEQRLAYYWGLPVLAVTLLAWNRLPIWLWYLLVLIGMGIFIWGAYVATYHAGVEYGFWPGPTACTGVGLDTLNFDMLKDINKTRVVPCDKVQFEIAGVSMAGLNALVQAVMIVLLLVGLGDQARRSARRAVA